ncbi:hypothetical protein [Sulfuriferula plumbiphila]|uniref:hypothetical protein n=1 Tax=Sulfuriferula plumbiphila TaxID=171865 RepID=UPI001CB99896|nr:hypothetical protein [Sulfuriferula plumbiphila]
MSANAAATRINVTGLFKGKAMVMVNGGRPRVLAAGESEQGARLVAADAQSATFEVDGKRRVLGMGNRMRAVAGGARPNVSLSADGRGHFLPPVPSMAAASILWWIPVPVQSPSAPGKPTAWELITAAGSVAG